jgi:Family of unknown function (DUF5302)
MESQPESSEPAKPANDVKDKFREALERKRGQAAAGDAHTEGGAKIGSQHGPAKTQRTFRRKSGG